MTTQPGTTETTTQAAPTVATGWRFRLPRITSMTFTASNPEAGDATSLTFRPTRPIRFRAGQHGLLIVPKGGFKPFSIASAPSQELITIGTRLSSGSKFKLALAALQPGDRVRFFGPLMNYTTDRTCADVVFLAQGVGITPIRSMLLDLTHRQAATSTTLVHVATAHPFRTDTEACADDAFYPTHSDTFRTLVADIIKDHQPATFMISGAPTFVTATKSFLRERGIPDHHIKLDSMRGY
jgi:glycine betaine catabolism B